MKKIFAFVVSLIVVLLFVGCVSDKSQNKNDTILKESPMLTVVNGESSIEAWKGTYSWNYKNARGKDMGVCADSVHPLGAKEFMPSLVLSSDILEQEEPFLTLLKFDVAPDNVSVRYWGDESWGDFGGAESNDLEVITESVNSVMTSYSIRLNDGNYIYEIIAEWKNNEKYNGTAHYGFYTTLDNNK